MQVLQYNISPLVCLPRGNPLRRCHFNSQFLRLLHFGETIRNSLSRKTLHMLCSVSRERKQANTTNATRTNVGIMLTWRMFVRFWQALGWGRVARRCRLGSGNASVSERQNIAFFLTKHRSQMSSEELELSSKINSSLSKIGSWKEP